MKMEGINKFMHRRIKNRQRVIAAVASLVFVFVFLVGGVDAETLYCDSCTNCTSTINSADDGDIVKLTQDISTTGTCIDFNNSNIIFDCQEYEITGDGTSGDGIYMPLTAYNQNMVKNCKIENFQNGIHIRYSDFNNLINNSINNNLKYGIYLYSGADSNNITGNEVTNNGDDGIYFTGASDSNYLSGNVICFNNEKDIDNATGNPIPNSGDNNTCDTTDNWADPGTGNCTFHCNPEINSSNSSGLDDEFDTGDWVYAYSDKLARKNVSVCVCIVANTGWSDGDNFDTERCYSKTANASGNLHASIWKPGAGDAGNYDMVLDVDCDERYDAYRDDVDSLNVGTFGFHIYPESETLVLLSFGLFVLYGFIRFGRKSKF